MAPLYLGGLVNEIISRLIKIIIFCRGLNFVFAITTLDMNIFFGLGTANFISVVIVGAVKISDQTLSITVSNLITIGFAGFIFGPAIVGFLAEYYGLTFNMYLFNLGIKCITFNLYD